MPNLILLNGPPGIGKSTLAHRYAQDHPLTLNLDIDRVRAMIGGWRDDPAAAGLLARAATLAAARAHLGGGHDVIVPQFLGHPRFIGELEETATATGARFHEIVLSDGREEVLRRFAARDPDDPAFADAFWLLERGGGLAELAAMDDRLTELLAERPAAVVIVNRDGDEDGTYRTLLATLAR